MSKATFPAMEACGNLIRTARAEDGSGGWHVAEVAVTHIEGEASRRARLFAAAPHLLDVLLELTDLEGPLPGNQEWHAKALAAISKAMEA